MRADARVPAPISAVPHDPAAGGIVFEADRHARVRTATFHGRIDDAILLESYARLLRAPDFDPTLHDVVDLSDADLQISATALWKLIGMLAQLDSLGRRTRVALVAVQTVAYGLARMYELIRSSSPGSTEEVRVYRDRETALKWARTGEE
jgi:hypothetical protein